MKVSFDYGIGDRVVPDDSEIVMIVTAAMIRGDNVSYELSYIWNAESRSWLGSYRLKAAE